MTDGGAAEVLMMARGRGLMYSRHKEGWMHRGSHEMSPVAKSPLSGDHLFLSGSGVCS